MTPKPPAGLPDPAQRPLDEAARSVPRRVPSEQQIAAAAGKTIEERIELEKDLVAAIRHHGHNTASQAEQLILDAANDEGLPDMEFLTFVVGILAVRETQRIEARKLGQKKERMLSGPPRDPDAHDG